MKKILTLVLLAGAAMILSACSSNNSANNKTDSNENLNSTSAVTEAGKNWINTCKSEKVSLPNYGDPGKRLKSCFVEFPGEPSRQDKSYYIVEDICGQFTKEFVENMLGQKVVKTEPPKIASFFNCTYYLNEKEYLLFNLEYLKIANQKLFYEQFGDKIEKSPEIPMDNLVLSQGPKAVKGTVYLVLGPEKFISITPSSENAEKMVNLVDFAAKIAKEIKSYK
jgi:hypothetical protein